VGGQSSGTTPPAPAAGGAAGAKSAPVFAPPKRSFMSFLPFIGIGVVVLAVLGWVAFTFFGAPKTTPISKEPSLQTEQKPGTTTQQNGTTPQRQVVPGTSTKITYWGLWEPSSVLTEVFKEYEQANPGVTIEYVQQSYKDYRERLQTAVAGGTGLMCSVFMQAGLRCSKMSWRPCLLASLVLMNTKRRSILWRYNNFK
jgi:hypothetical protein